jgi:hypothetical protein
MKPQDILFIIILLGLLFLKKPRILVGAALFCFVLSIPLFYRLVFFTAERLVMYAAGFLLVSIIMFWITMRK